MIGSSPTALVARATPSARVARRGVATEGMGGGTVSVGSGDHPPRILVGSAAPGFDPSPVGTPSPAMRKLASTALAAILELRRGG